MVAGADLRFAKNYTLLKSLANEGIGSNAVTDQIEKVVLSSLSYLQRCVREPLLSKVSSKSYFAFSKGKRLSRAVNESLFVEDRSYIQGFMTKLRNNGLGSMNADEITAACYSAAMSFCCAIDLAKSGNKKSPGTYFEYLIGNILSKYLSKTPQKEIEVLSLDKPTTLPTDYIFDLGADQARLHFPVKTSTRERAIQVWAHQRILDGIYGVDQIRGILICLAETKLETRTREVVEICLPEQWKVYQLFISQLKRVYYLDIPERYEQLCKDRPSIVVKSFGEFFRESEEILS